jgi:hypothetical protein
MCYAASRQRHCKEESFSMSALATAFVASVIILVVSNLLEV